MAATRVPFSVESVKWQDYRANNTGMVVYYTSDPVSDIPIREIPEEVDSPVAPEPHYETGTYGLYSCSRPKVRSAFLKSKLRYLFFVTKYGGTNAEYRDKNIITGFYHVVSTADASKLHIRYCREYECLDVSACVALRADEVHFVLAPDSFVLDETVMKEWEYAARITRQTRIILNEEQTLRVLDHLRAKPNALQAYLDETERLQPHGHNEEPSDEQDVSEPQSLSVEQAGVADISGVPTEDEAPAAPGQP